MKTFLLSLLFAAMAAGQTVQGDIVNAATGAPLAGAHIIANVANGKPLIVKADAGGHFQLSAGTGPMFFLLIGYPGFLPASRGFQQSQAGADLRIALTPAAVIAGTIQDEDGFPVYQAQVEAVRYRLQHGRRVLSPAASTQSDDLGHYRLANLPAGRYWVRVSAFRLANWDRRYAPQYFPGGLQPDGTNRIEVQAGQERSVDIRMTKHDGVTIAGRVEMPSGAVVSTGPNWVELLTDRPGGQETTSSVPTSGGSFVIRHVPAGSYILRARAAGNYPPTTGDLVGEQKLEVGDADEPNVVVAMHQVQPVDVAGTVVMDDGSKPPPLYVTARSMMGPGVTAQTAEDGSFALKGLLWGHYELATIPSRLVDGKVVDGSPAYTISARLGEQEVLETGFDVEASSPGPLRITMSNRHIALTGSLTDDFGKPAADVTLAFVLNGAWTENVGNTDGHGVIHASVRQAGDYHIYVVPDQSSIDDEDYVEQHANDFPIIHLVDGANAPLVLRMPATQ
jgi:hypothetical protein